MTPDRPLRLCILANFVQRHRGYFTPHTGLLTRALVGLGHEVTVLTAELPGGGGGVEVIEGAEVHFLDGIPPKSRDDRYWKTSAAVFDRLHAERKFDIVFGRGLATWGFLRFSRHAAEVPLILHEGTFPRWLHQVETRGKALGRLLGAVLAPLFALKNRKLAKCMQRAARVVCITPELAQGVRRNLWWHPPRALSITYGFDTGPYQPSAQPDQPPRLVSVGRLAWDKGVLAMIDVLARLTNRTVTLAAMGPGADKVRKAMLDRASQRGVSDRYAAPGVVPQAELPERLAGATAFLFPSTHAEGLGKVVLEAMAAGVPVVAYRLPVLESIIEDGVTGFLVPMRDVAAMTDRVERLIADPALVNRMGRAARQKIETAFSPDAINAEWRSLLAEVVDEAAARRGQA